MDLFCEEVIMVKRVPSFATVIHYITLLFKKYFNHSSGLLANAICMYL